MGSVSALHGTLFNPVALMQELRAMQPVYVT